MNNSTSGLILSKTINAIDTNYVETNSKELIGSFTEKNPFKKLKNNAYIVDLKKSKGFENINIWLDFAQKSAKQATPMLLHPKSVF